MKYEVIDKELNIKACSIGDLTMQQVKSFLELWDGERPISTLTAFVDNEDNALVLNKDNQKYGLYLAMCKKYLSTTDEKRSNFREEVKDDPCYSTVQILDNLIKRRRDQEIFKMLDDPRIVPEYPRHVFDVILKKYDFSGEKFRMWKAYTYGVIQGKRMERARRKAGTANETN